MLMITPSGEELQQYQAGLALTLALTVRYFVIPFTKAQLGGDLG